MFFSQQAVIMEIQRYANVVPNGMIHMCQQDLTVNGMTIPANTLIRPLFTEILKGDHWKDGTSFKPERFLDEEGNLKRDDHWIPFSTGKRKCLGETFAKAQLFVFFTSMIHQFKFLPENDEIIPPEDYIPGATILPSPFKVKLVSRI